MNQQTIEGLLQQGRIDEALVQCNAVLQVTPCNARVLGLLGVCHYRKQDYALAADCFRRATTLDPKFVDAGIKHAQCLDRLHKYEDAFNVANEWLHVQPSNTMLRGLVESLREHSRGTSQGWERTVSLGKTVHLGSE